VDTKFEGGEISYHYNHTDPGKEGEGNSKGFVVQSFQKQGAYVFCAGDGQSDLEAARVADVTFAHRNLATFCDDEKIAYQPFKDFRGMLVAVRNYSLNGSNSNGTPQGVEA
jgi:2-hydroxy-3-keto-5-methylthiopentenyl-1-phosphate phosphatase